MKNVSVDRVTVLAIAIPMVALLFVGYLSQQNTSWRTLLPKELTQ
jgi:hypothetical protein